MSTPSIINMTLLKRKVKGVMKNKEKRKYYVLVIFIYILRIVNAWFFLFYIDRIIKKHILLWGCVRIGLWIIIMSLLRYIKKAVDIAYRPKDEKI